MTRFSYIFLAYSSLFILGFIDNARGPFYPEFLNHFDILDNIGSYIFSLASLASFVTTVLTKKWFMKLGLIKSSRLFLAVQALSVLCIALSGKFHSFYLMLFASALFGMAVGGLGICNNLLVSKGANPVRLRQFFSGLHSMYGLASICAPILVSWSLQNQISWADFFYFFALIALVPFIYSFTVKSVEKKNMQDKSIAIAPRGLSIIVFILFGFYVASEIVISSRLVIYLQTYHKMDKSQSASYLTYFFIFLLIGRLLVSIRSWKISNNILLNISVILSFIMVVLGLYLHPFFLTLTGLTMSYFFPCATSLLSEKFPTLLEDLMTKLMTGINISLFIMHWLFGQISTSFGIQSAMHMSLVYLLIVFILLKKIVSYQVP